jgi:hypothetical protein
MERIIHSVNYSVTVALQYYVDKAAALLGDGLLFILCRFIDYAQARCKLH